MDHELATKAELALAVATIKTKVAQAKAEMLKWIATGVMVLQTIGIVGVLVGFAIVVDGR